MKRRTHQVMPLTACLFRHLDRWNGIALAGKHAMIAFQSLRQIISGQADGLMLPSAEAALILSQIVATGLENQFF